MTWTPYAVGVAALLAVAVAAPAVDRWARRRTLARLRRIERDLEILALTRRRPSPRKQLLRELSRQLAAAPEDPGRGTPPYSWGADLDLFAALTLEEIRALPETREPAA